MELSLSSIEASVRELKEENLFEIDPYKLIDPSAYDTAWLAMVPDSSEPLRPMFQNCLVWVLDNQKVEGFWGECDGHVSPTIECLPATIACLVALKRWNAGEGNLQKGMAFIQEKAEKVLGQTQEEHSCPRGFAIVFPAMVELAHANGLGNIFTERFKRVLKEIFHQRQQILEKEELVNSHTYPPLLSYLEALPLYTIEEEQICKHLCEDGSLFHSPSATASAFMATGNTRCLRYLKSLAQKCSTNGVPTTYPIDGELIKICLVNQLERLGLAEHFYQEIEERLYQVNGDYMRGEQWTRSVSSLAPQLLKDSLAFRILRMHGYNVSPRSFCWFLQDMEIQDLIENNHEFFSSVMLNVYRATDLLFPGEHELEEARAFSKKILEKIISTGTKDQFDAQDAASNLQKMIENELKLPWLARMDHLEHREWIEEKNITALWMGKSSYHRLSHLHMNKLLQLAAQNYHSKQSVYQKELQKLTSWASRWGLCDMGFSREKTTYCYFAIAASSSLPLDSAIRMIVAKSAIVITVADDFYDMEGSLDELESLTDAIRRWGDNALCGHGKTIFDALDNLVGEIEEMYLQLEGISIKDNLRFIWHETFDSWLTEAKWSRTGHLPSTEEYLENGAMSVATHTMVLPASCFLKPGLPVSKLRPLHYETITKLLMLITRLLNDIQGYKKEQKEGKSNYVLLYLEENPEATIEDSIAYVRGMLERKKLEFVKHALMDGLSDLSKPSRRLHFSCLKVFQMFYHSSNRYDSDTTMLRDIQKAIHLPIEFGPPETATRPRKQVGPQKPMKPPLTKMLKAVVTNLYAPGNCKHFGAKLGARISVSSTMPTLGCMNLPRVTKFKPCFL